jgi:hypothetical protein
MNDERAAIIDMVIRKQLPAAAAVRLLGSLLHLETGEEGVIEPPCRRPPWWEVDRDLDALLWAQDCASLLPSATYQLAKGLEAGNMERGMVHFSALEVMYLANFWTESTDTRFTYGSMVLAEREGALHQDWFDHVVGAGCIALWLFSHPFPIETTRRQYGRSEEESSTRVATTAFPEPDLVSTTRGDFKDCLRVVRHTSKPCEGAALDHSASLTQSETLTVWLARGTGPVRIHRERFDSSVEQIELSACAGSDSDPEHYFPRKPGCWWRFDSSEGGWLRRELWRVLAHPEEGSSWLITSAYLGKIE